METASEPFDPLPGRTGSVTETGRQEAVGLTGLRELPVTAPEAVTSTRLARVSARAYRTQRKRRSPEARRELLWITVIYLAVRIVMLIAAYLYGTFNHLDIQGELAHWDGLWYRELANNGYPSHVSYLQTTLGFFPLFPIAIWLLEPVFTTLTVHNQIWASTVSGLVISGIGGWVATIMVHRLAKGWWGIEAARRATILFVVFPGAIVFSMVYSEGLLLSLAAGCLYALERRRWVLAGLLAGFGTAVQPVGLVLVFSCAATALLEFRRCDWSWRRARASLAAPALSVSGAVAFAVFLWAWTGSPFANYIAQHHGWSEKTDPLAIVHLTTRLANQISTVHHVAQINLNLVVGLIGTVLLVVMLVLLWYSRHEVSIGAIVWTLGISFLALTSEYVPPNPRLLITAFPALMVLARYTRGKWFEALATSSFVLLVVLGTLTFVGTTLRP